ncbi:MAG: hypothetical protein KatS3mg021_1427 [Fimbriimonadales bacterium]|nr:MAG: hypothetical protein KatS3mg021_1427 [Fimbriimonadales bacterium]
MMMRNLMSHRRRERGFTLVEIMIVVLIIGILLAIAVPSFMNARERSRAKCVPFQPAPDSGGERAVGDGDESSTRRYT